MKALFLKILFLIPLLANANMATPIYPGTLGLTPFINQYINIIHENIFIKIDENFEYAYYEVEYIIESEKRGISVPLLFYAFEYEGDFKVSMDGNSIELKKYPDRFENKDEKYFDGFNHLFDSTQSQSLISLVDQESSDYSEVNSDHLLYFETDIDKGKHIIKVSYNANRWQHKNAWIKSYSFRYALAPAEYWKSFGTLDVTVDASEFHGNMTSNLGEINNAELNRIARWSFNDLPEKIIKINYRPDIDGIAEMLIKLGPAKISFLILLFFILFHIYLIAANRKKKLKILLSPIVIVGGLLIPIIYILILILIHLMIDSLIGIHASGIASYGSFYGFTSLPLYWLLYILFSGVVEFSIKKKLA